MAELTKDKIRQFLRPFLNTLLAPELVTLRTNLLTAILEQDIPSSLRSALRLQEFLYPPHKIAEIILTEFDSLLEERCNSGTLVSQENFNWINNYVNQRLIEYLVNCEDQTQITNHGEDVPSIILQIAHSHLYSIANLSKETPEIFAKRSGNSEKLTLLAKYPIIILSNFITQIESWFTAFPGQIQEVHFIAQYLFLADCSLDQSKWHGINISIICNKFEYVKSSHDDFISWDLSGHNGKKHDLPKAGQDQNGLDGVNGENGGNLVIIANEHNGLKNLKVISNAGSGGNGQHGGDGKDGKPGKEISYAKLTTLFPPSVICSKEGRHFLLKNAIGVTNGGTRDKLLVSPETAFDMNTGTVTQTVDECFVEASTENGLKLFLYFRSNFCTKSIVCLVQGTNGSPGQPGGFGGSPGKPGQPGIVQFFKYNNLEEPLNSDDIGIAEIQCKTGEIGRQGADGVNGSNGDSGKDIGYMFVNGKELGQYRGGTYELLTETQKTHTNCVKGNILGGKFLRIESQISSPYNVISATVFRGDTREIETDHQNFEEVVPQTSTVDNTSWPKELFKLYGSFVSANEMGSLLNLMNDGKWWVKTIIDLSETGSSQIKFEM